jgi:hypothetical protein
MKLTIFILVCYFLSLNLNAQKKLIAWPEEGAYGHPSYLAARWSYIETLPFDGVAIFLPPYQWQS